MADVRTLKDRVAELAAGGKLAQAIDVAREVVALEPGDVASRRRLADLLRRAGRDEDALAAYRDVAARFARDGLLLKAIAICKTILDLDPGHVETQGALATLYARRAAAEERAPRGGAILGDAATPFRQILDAAGGPAAVAAAEDLLAGAEARDGHAAAARGAPSAGVPAIPIFSDLSREAFVALTAATALRRAGPGDAVLREGEEGTSFYVVVTGSLSVTKGDDRGGQVALARLGEGDFFGEMALLSGAARTATVVAEDPCELLEFRADVLLDLAGTHPQLAASLRRFYRQRLLANAMAVSPIFRPLAKGDRKLVMERFRARDVRPGDVVVREGERSDGLYVVLEGALEVRKRKGAAEVVAGALRAGDLFGEMSLLRKAPATATVVVRRAGTVLRLPRREFDELVVTHPQVLEVVSELTDERAESLDAIVSGHAQWTEDGLVLI